ncbi:MBL fold metallo-hydrolase [Pseudorhodobacter antarcticus]|nr:MBL fold metallo-hydrolase [Pseudorhodobacter antarcticus]
MMRFLALPAALLLATPLFASEDIADQYPQSLLYSKPVEVIPHVFTAIGATAPPTYDNAGHNNNLSFIITGDGVIVVNSGASYLLARALHDEIKIQTDQPVKLVINENGQGHAMLGNNYWIEQGVPVLAHADAATEFADSAGQSLTALKSYARENATGTEPMGPTDTFTDPRDITMGDFRVEILHLGPAHSPGDTQVWLPDQGLMIAGDIAFHERMPPIFEGTCTLCWIETWEGPLTDLSPTYIIPGHGHPTNFAQVTRYTRDYLVHLRGEIAKHLDVGGDLAGAYYVDQSAYTLLDTFEELATKNAGVVFTEMEFE